MHAGSYGLTPADGQAQPAGRPETRRGAVSVAGPVGPGAAAGGRFRRPAGDGARPGGRAGPRGRGGAGPRPGRPDTAGWPAPCGKTQLAAGLAGSLWQSRTVDLLAWVTATSRASILSGYAQAAAELGLDHGRDAEVVAARFLAWLDGTARPWLVVLDDLRDAADLDGLWPAGPAGRVLITAADAAAVPGERQVRWSARCPRSASGRR